MPGKSTLAVIYTRYSPRPGAGECISCETQSAFCRDYMRKKEYIFRGSTHDDREISGADMTRPAFDDVISEVKRYRGLYEEVVVIVASPDRLARDILVDLALRKRIEEVGARLEFADGSPSGGSPESELMANVFAAFAQYERARIQERTSRGIKKRQAQGEFFGKVPIGYERDRDKSTTLKPFDQERAAVAYAKELSRKRYQSRDIANLISSAYGPFRGGEWKPRTVRKMIKKTHNWEK